MDRELRYGNECPHVGDVEIKGKLRAGYDQGTQVPENFAAPSAKLHRQSPLSSEQVVFAARVGSVFDLEQ